ncbi:hypothetical protein HMPREF6745_0538 [Prevotella sp. oral taxon 472 str. F0295]|nr:hypothetical protein HMPREF6745_0538 [Prevotella sp. oral taxon 472 str. F0295]
MERGYSLSGTTAKLLRSNSNDLRLQTNSLDYCRLNPYFSGSQYCKSKSREIALQWLEIKTPCTRLG